VDLDVMITLQSQGYGTKFRCKLIKNEEIWMCWLRTEP